MAKYAVGDLQGCASALEALLDKTGFNSATDELWLAGDLVNRGPESLRTLRLVRSLGSSAISVLGNHDLHLLAVASGVKPERPNDTLRDILNASDRDELIHWLCHQPLMHSDKSVQTLMVHAGIYPGWSQGRARALAQEVEAVLQSSDRASFFENMYGKAPGKWSKDLQGWERLTPITADR